ncbi:MAG: hypothetical protein RRY23_08565, partial [Alistipes sp.]
FLFLCCKSDFSELNEDLQDGNWGEKSRKEEINKFKTVSKRRFGYCLPLSITGDGYKNIEL